VTKRRILVPAIVAVIAFALFMPVVCAGSSEDSTLGCDTVFGWTLPGSAIEGPEIIIYVIPLVLAIIVFAVTRSLLRRRDRAADATTSRS
jgi:phosphotransferase system  glucose/maltose/N-acetylglucosamine-specific IIC component